MSLGVAGVAEGWKQWQLIGSLQGSAETKAHWCRQLLDAPETIAAAPAPASALTLARLPFSSGVFTVLLFSTLVCEGVWGFDSGD